MLRQPSRYTQGVSSASSDVYQRQHQNGEINYPFKEESIDELENTFQPEKRGYYCLQWGNSGKEKVEMNYHFNILKRASVND